MNSDKMYLSLGYILVSIIWGSTWLVIKIGLDSITPFYAIAIRFTSASLILFLIIKINRINFPVSRRALLLYLYLGLLSFSFPFALVYWGEQYIASGLASVLFSSFPFVVAVLSHYFLPAEKLNFYKFLGIILAFAGILVIFESDIKIGGSGTLGMAAILGSTLMQGVSLIIIKKSDVDIGPISLSLGGMISGLVIIYPMAIIFEDISNVHFDGKGIGSILYLSTIGTVVAYVVYYWMLRRMEAVYLSLISFITPIIALILGTLLLNEHLSPRIYSGAALVFFGILLTHGRDFIKKVQKVNN